MTTKANNTPIDTLRDGAIKATIWKNTGEKGDFYSVEFSRTYKEGETFKDSHSFSGSELLRVSRLADIAYTEIGFHRENDRKAAEQAA